MFTDDVIKTIRKNLTKGLIVHWDSKYNPLCYRKRTLDDLRAKYPAISDDEINYFLTTFWNKSFYYNLVDTMIYCSSSIIHRLFFFNTQFKPEFLFKIKECGLRALVRAMIKFDMFYDCQALNIEKDKMGDLKDRLFKLNKIVAEELTLENIKLHFDFLENKELLAQRSKQVIDERIAFNGRMFKASEKERHYTQEQKKAIAEILAKNAKEREDYAKNGKPKPKRKYVKKAKVIKKDTVKKEVLPND